MLGFLGTFGMLIHHLTLRAQIPFPIHFFIFMTNCTDGEIDACCSLSQECRRTRVASASTDKTAPIRVLWRGFSRENGGGHRTLPKS